MPIVLTDELRHAFHQNGDKPVELTDCENRRYILLSADDYLRLIRQSENEIIDPSFYEAGEFIPESK